MTVFEIQKALASKGFDPGNIDGVWGRRTAQAVRSFQAVRGLQVDGVVGPVTAAALNLPPAAAKADTADDAALVWFQEARRLKGLREGPGDADNPDLMRMAQDLKLDYRSDDIPWCGLFAAHCIGATLTTEPLPANPLSARGWRRFGGPCTPRPGAVMVFWRGRRDGWQGHVAFYVGEDDQGFFHVLGGNQSDAVTVTRINRTRLLEARWPATVALSAAGPRLVKADGQVSAGEQ
ncbi:TIGR02594 family protein [Caulobacter sp. B11]|uniref:NlpC/P60 family protein n=1 Tax=Caulobacter sp. B11 TaxID=2048899 RepID=UPI000C12A235|nr:TIGR02594 family protein [Caulobacter sp. B11]PHY14306.1 TIGR02594 family protein [Caulobacter sp. B11]